MKGNRWLIAIALVLMVVIVAACAPAPTPTPLPAPTKPPPTAAPPPTVAPTVAPTKPPEPTKPPTAPPPSSITIVDTNSGSNFQTYFKTKVVPQLEKEFNVKVNYVVSSGPEIIQRLKAWEAGKGDIHLLWLKDDDIASMTQQKIPLEKLPTDVITNMAKCPKSSLEAAHGVPLNGTGALYWRSQYALIYNSAKVSRPPTSWKEYYDRRAEWKGHIGWVRPDAKSGGGRNQFYAALTAFGVDFSKPFAEVQASAAWKDAWEKFKDFQTYSFHPIAAEPPVMFDQMKSEDVWLAVYALDYSLWSRDQGNLPPTMKASYFSDGLPSGSDMYFAVPAYIPDAYKPLAYRIINFLLSDEQQIQLITTMWQYTGTDIDDKVPAKVWDTIPKWSEISKIRIRLTNKDAVDFIKKKGMDYVPGG